MFCKKCTLSKVLAPISDDPFPTFCFETSCPERFQNVAHLMRLELSPSEPNPKSLHCVVCPVPRGDTAHVVDQVSAVKVQKSMGQPLPRQAGNTSKCKALVESCCVRLIHYPSTAESWQCITL